MMRAAISLALVTALLGSEQDDQGPDLRSEVEAQTRAMSAAFARDDMRAVARFYADDAALYHPGGIVTRGRAQLDTFWSRIEHPVSWTMTTIDVGGSRDEPHQLVASVLVQDEAGGHRTVSRTMCLFIWRRDASGRLRVHIDMYTHQNR